MSQGGGIGDPLGLGDVGNTVRMTSASPTGINWVNCQPDEHVIYHGSLAGLHDAGSVAGAQATSLLGVASTPPAFAGVGNNSAQIDDAALTDPFANFFVVVTTDAQTSATVPFCVTQFGLGKDSAGGFRSLSIFPLCSNQVGAFTPICP